MSARLLKKFLTEQEAAQGKQQQHQPLNSGGFNAPEENEVIDSDEPESPDSPKKAYVNPFDLLNDGDEDDGDDKDQGSEPEVVEVPLIKAKELASKKAPVNAAPASNQKAKKKKKKKQQKDPLPSTQNSGKTVDALFDNLTVEDGPSSNQPGPSKAKSANAPVSNGLLKRDVPSILQVDPKFLSAENELKRIFGSKVVKSFQKSNQASGSRQLAGGRRGGHSHRRTILVSPLEHWPRWDGSLSMELLETKEGYNYFKYVHSSSYYQAQRGFEAAKAIHDLNGIASILMHHPYHLDSLITMAEYFQFSGEHQMSSDCIAKCLYALECAWHPMFNPLQGYSRLKYSHESNRPLFSALFAHMKNMNRRGCHRSALEICKLLLSLDPDDPKGALFCIDYFSLRAEEYTWLEQFSEEYSSDNSLWLFPNFSLSLAISRFYIEQGQSSEGTQLESDKATSTDLLKQALMLHPSVLKKLVEKVPLKDQAWTNILKKHFFASDQSGSPSLDHLIKIYVERSYIIWRLPDLQKLLRNSALLVIETLENNKSEAEDWVCIRKEAFSSEKNEYSHLSTPDFSDSVPTMPQDNLQNFLIDPRMMREVPNGDHQPVGNHPPQGARAPRDVANRNPLAVLFESMLPWVDYGGGDHPNDQIHDNEED